MRGGVVEGGTTLIEMILYIGIVSVLLIGVGAVSMSATEVKSKTRAISDVFSSATGVMGTILRLVGGGDAVVSPVPGTSSSTLTIRSTTPGAPLSSIYASDGALFLAVGADTPVRLHSEEVRVENLMFTSVGNLSTSTAIHVSFGLSASTTGVWQVFQYTESFSSSVVLGKHR